MSSVYGFYASSVSSTSSSSTVGMSGLVSGMDTDSIVKAMTSGTSSKISKVQQNLMKLQWKQESYQDVGTALTDFKSKYLSSTGESSISSLLASCKNITATGDNAGCVTATGSTNILSTFSVLGVSQLASNASYSSKTGVTSGTIASGTIDFSSTGKDVSAIAGKKLVLKVGDTNYSMEFDDTVITDQDSLVSAIKSAMSKCETKDSSGRYTISDLVDVSVDGEGKLSLATKSEAGSDLITVSSSSNSTLLKTLGIAPDKEGRSKNGSSITGDAAINYDSLKKNQAFISSLYGQNNSVTLDLDGEKATIKFTDEMLDAIENAEGDEAKLTELVNQMQSQLDKVYGGKVEITADTTNMSFSMNLKAGLDTSILSVASGSSELTGTSGVLGLTVGSANRLLTSATLENVNLKNKFDFGDDGDKTYDMEVNGIKFTIGKNKITVDGKETEYASGVSISNVLTAINSSDANVKISYLSTTDRFMVASTVSGASGSVSMSGSFADMLFGDGVSEAADAEGKYPSSGVVYGAGDASDAGSFTEGKDCKVLVSFDGNTVDEVTRSTNSFKLDGLSLSFSSTFNTELTTADFTGADASSKIASQTGKIGFTSSVDSKALTEAFKTMIEDYNSLIDKVVGYYTTKNDPDYQPLTSDMIKDEDLTDDQAELYNDKAKEGMLFGDSILGGLLNDLRGIFTGMTSVGFKASSDYTEYGKITFDAEKFTAALEADTESVTDLFTKEKTGALSKLDTLMTKYVNSSMASPGLITSKSGLASSSISQMNSAIYKEMESTKSQLDSLKDKLSTQEDRYYKQFTNMEKVLNNLNNQASYLSSL